ncbi:MAG: polysaccharide deacetylase family protein, partial [Acidobacteriota bacterium]
MKKVFLPIIFTVFLCNIISLGQTQRTLSKTAKPRTVAITFDDLPSGPEHDVKTLETLTIKLLHTLMAHNVPVVGFVNEGKLHRANEFEIRRSILKKWLDNGFELGNHTYSHPYFFQMPVTDFQQDVIRGEVVITDLLKKKGMKLRYFRHPFLSTGPDQKTKVEFEKFLSSRGYTVAPVTIDNSDWLFAAVYTYAFKR